MEDASLSRLREAVRSYKRQSWRLRRGLEGLEQRPSLNMTFEAGGELGGSFDEHPSLVRLAALLRPFLTPDSTVFFQSIWNMLKDTGELEPSTVETVEASLTAATRPTIPIKLNNLDLTARDIYSAYAEGELFGDDAGAKQLLAQFSAGPTRALLLFAFYDACIAYSHLILAVVDALLELESKMPGLNRPAVESPRCIYCLHGEGDFESEEHVIPEAFGQDELVLRGAVCDSCNNALSVLDQHLVEFEPIAMLRVMYLPMTKSGKFPRADLREMTVSKTKPREIRFHVKGSHDPFNLTKQDDGTVRIQFQTRGKQPLDAVTLGRALFKIGLGLVAYDKGVEYACDARFDRARAFIRGAATMPSVLFVPTSAQPHPQIHAAWLPADNGTPVALDFYGILFMFNLEPTPVGLNSGLPDGLFQELPLE